MKRRTLNRELHNRTTRASLENARTPVRREFDRLMSDRKFLEEALDSALEMIQIESEKNEYIQDNFYNELDEYIERVQNIPDQRAQFFEYFLTHAYLKFGEEQPAELPNVVIWMKEYLSAGGNC